MRSHLPRGRLSRSRSKRSCSKRVNGLRPDDRLLIAYRYWLELSEAEMAEALGCPRGTVKSRLSRALGRLRERLPPRTGEVDLVHEVGSDG